MPTFHFNKLIRGKLTGMYDELNQKIVSRRLIGRELLLQLRTKVVEETEEIPLEDVKLPLEGDKRTAIIREIGDVKQGLQDMQELLGISDEEVEVARLEKLEQKGGFAEGIFVETIELKDDDPWVEYYRKEPQKYPEVSGSSDLPAVKNDEGV